MLEIQNFGLILTRSRESRYLLSDQVSDLGSTCEPFFQILILLKKGLLLIFGRSWSRFNNFYFQLPFFSSYTASGIQAGYLHVFFTRVIVWRRSSFSFCQVFTIRTAENYTSAFIESGFRLIKPR